MRSRRKCVVREDHFSGRARFARILVVWLVLLCFAPLDLRAAPEEQARATSDTVGAGIWKSRSQGLARATQEWSLVVRRGDDDSLHGRMSIGDSPSLEGGNVHGRVSGKAVSGTITDDDGNFLAAFEGQLDGEEMSGTYRSADGDSGTWRWSEPAAKQMVSERAAPKDDLEAPTEAKAVEEEVASELPAPSP